MSVKGYIKRGLTYIFKGVPQKNITASISYTSPSEQLKGKNIIVTGGGRGLGFAMAKKFMSEGANILIAGRNEETLKKSADIIGCKYLPLDMQNIDSFDTFVEQADKMLGGINCLVNNAGISLHESTFFDVTPESFDAQFGTNLRGAFFLTQKVASLMKSHARSGSILFISSETGETVDIRPYGLTKAAVNSLVKGLAYLFAKDGIRVNAVAPGVTTSDMTGYKADENLYLPFNAIERVYLPEEVAETAKFLLSDISGCISGQIIVCNNARTVNPRWK